MLLWLLTRALVSLIRWAATIAFSGVDGALVAAAGRYAVYL
jgi:hypothetical protein